MKGGTRGARLSRVNSYWCRQAHKLWRVAVTRSRVDIEENTRAKAPLGANLPRFTLNPKP
jgi:hypothetical protein